MNYDITVVTAIYNTGEYIERCVRSLLEQSFRNIEFLFIDDASTDQSISILNKTLAEYSDRKNDVNLIKLSSNFGPAYVKQLGIFKAKGNYVICIDSDDYVDKEMLSEMHYMAIRTGAEIVTCNVMLEYKNRSICHKEYTSNNFEERMREIILNEHTNGYLCNKLVLKNLYISSNCFPPTSMRYLEDLFIVTRLYFNAKTIVAINKAFYHYVKYNLYSITNSNIHKLYDSHRLFWKLQHDFYKKQNLETIYSTEINTIKTLTHLDLIFRIENFSDYKYFAKQIKQLNLQLNPTLKSGQKIILLTLNKGQFLFSFIILKIIQLKNRDFRVN